MRNDRVSQGAVRLPGEAVGWALPSRVPVIALHCSGSDGNQWRRLAPALGPRFEVMAPGLIGSTGVGHWPGQRAFTLLDEATTIVEMLEEVEGPVHLVGHSYGGGVALKVASLHPGRIASLSLYEPSAFHILAQLGERAAAERAEIDGLAGQLTAGLASGAYQPAAAAFVDYWQGTGSWSQLGRTARQGVMHWLPKAPLDFRALGQDGTPLAHYREIACPVLVLRGELARGPSRLIAEEVARAVPAGRLEIVPGAGHMGPATHAALVNELLAEHIRASTVPAGWRPDAPADAGLMPERHPAAAWW